jgi:uncharacterized protein (TIGR02145 family)
MKKLFIVQYSHELDKFQLQEVENPQDLPNFEIPIIDASYKSLISMSAFQVDTEKPVCSLPDAQIFENPHNNFYKGHNYGLLYNSYTFQKANFAPEGWRVPDVDDYNELLSFVDVASNHAIVLIENNPDYNKESFNGLLNEYNFSLRAAGYRSNTGYFQSIGARTYLGTSVPASGQTAYSLPVYGATSVPSSIATYSKSGISIRLIKNDPEFIKTITDIDGNIYPTTKIGNQVWTSANWKCTKFNNGSPIPNITDRVEWGNLNTPAYCAYNNDLSYV